MTLLRTLINACVIVGLTTTCVPAQQSSGNSPRTFATQKKRQKWQPATYRGLTVGTSTLADALKVFGQPIRKDFADDADADEVWYVYNDAGEFPGQFSVAIDKKTHRVTALMIAMLAEVKKETVLERLGDDYEVVRYDACPDSPESEAGPFYESINGQAIYIEYRARGIAVAVDYKQEMVRGVDYLAQPPGLSSRKQCPPYPPNHRITKQKVKP